MWNSVRLPPTRGPVSAPAPGFVLDVYEDEDTSPPPAMRPAHSQVALRKLDAEVSLRELLPEIKQRLVLTIFVQQGSNLLTHPVLNHVAAANMPRDAEHEVAVFALMSPMQARDMKRYGF